MPDESEAMREALLLRAVYTILNRTCYMMADMSLMEYCLLCTVREHPSGLPVKALHAELVTIGTLDFYEEQLLSKELILRIRDAADHRALAFSVTAKGSSLVDHLDPEMAISVLEQFPQATEASFQQAAELMADYAARMEPFAECTTIFPASVLKTLNAYRVIATTETSRLSLTFLGLCIFCLCALSAGELPVASAARHMGMPMAVFMHNLRSLEERGLVELVHEGEAIVLTEVGQRRLRLLLGRITARFSGIIGARHAEESYAALRSFLLYLMG